MSRLKTALIVLTVIAVLWMGQEVFVPLVLSFLMAMLLSGPVRRLERLRLPRVAAVTITVALACGALAFVGYLVGNQLYTFAMDLEKYQDEIVRKIEVVRGTGPGVMDKIEETSKKLEEATSTPVPPPPAATQSASTLPTSQPVIVATQPAIVIAHGAVVERPASSGPVEPSDDERATTPDGSRTNPLFAYVMPVQPSPFRTLTSYVGVALSPLATAGLVVIFVFFILLQREDLRDRAIRLVSNGQYTLTTTAVDDGVDRIVRYIRAQAIVNGTYGIAVALGLWIIGLTLGGGTSFPSFLLWGLLAAVLRFVPYIGPWLAAAFPITLSIAAYNGFGVFSAVIIMFVVIELVSNNIMEPILYGSTTGLSVMAILVSAVFWTWLWGPIGLLLATPLTVVMMVVGRYVPGLGFLEILLGDKPAMTPPERVYQRLMAGDEDEALAVTEQYMQDNDIKGAYDDVLLPALSMAEQDASQGLLNAERRSLVLQGTRRIIEEVTEAHVRRQELQKQKEEAEAATHPATAAAALAVKVAATAAVDAGVRVAVLPAHDEADELAGLMLSKLLHAAGLQTLHVTQHTLAGEMVEKVREFDPHVVFVSSTPPAAVSHVRYLLRRVRGGLPVEKLAIGVWSAKSDIDTLKKRLELENTTIATSLTQAVEQVRQMTEQDRIAARKQRDPAEPIAASGT